MTPNSLAFDHWIRNRFVELNTELELIYKNQNERINVNQVGDQIKKTLEDEGRDLIKQLLSEGNTDEGFDNAFDLLGNVGLYMASCRRHEITDPSRDPSSPLKEASGLAMNIGASIGVVPRFATAHLSTHNKAVDGVYKSFTSLPAEKLFLDYNTKAILAYKRAADALLKLHSLGISHPMCHELLEVVKVSLNDVIQSNQFLFDQLSVDDFFFSVRPYYKPYHVGFQVYRGANAGDFAGINVIDILLGLCLAKEPSYSQMLVDKFMYMMPEDQGILRDCMRRTSFMDDFLNAADTNAKWYQNNLTLFLDICELHGEAATQHHNQLVKKYIATPSNALKETQLDNITASGPPLEVLISALEKLRDRRAAADRNDIPTRFKDIETLKKRLAKYSTQNMNYKEDFILTNANYLLNHSVGRPLKETKKIFTKKFFEPWSSSLDEPWNQWLPVINHFTNELAQLFNAKKEEFCPQINLSSGLTKILQSFEESQDKKMVVLMSEVDFPGMGFVLQKALPNHSEIRFIPSQEDVTDYTVWEKYLTDDIGMVFISHAYSNTGQLSPIDKVLSLTRSKNILSILDVAQSVGIVPIDLSTLQPDFMIGSSVKWLCGGPGAAYLWVNSSRLPYCEPRDVGWFSHENPFEFDIHDFRYNETAMRFWGGTPSIAPYVIAAHSINYFNKIGIKKIRQHNQMLIEKISEEFDEEFVSPRDEAKRGGTMILDFKDHQETILKNLKENNIYVDLRSQGIRISPHIYNDEADMNHLIKVIRATKL
ncbi:aminotransferase class V-fold PLP-dependent enzyme [Candidatus Pseudothioglobus singularis]|nr:aminotransferase class V-fold PLP-dependent enzyme [Candidatus Pseudothioglobus singularis]